MLEKRCIWGNYLFGLHTFVHVILNLKLSNFINKFPHLFSAMPDLIRLVHGNLAGIKKLVKEFRLYWKHKTSGKQSETDQDSEEKMEIDEQTAKTDIKPMNEGDLKDGSDVKPSSATVAEVDFSISKRQLEIKITSIATREKRDTYKKICWYVNDSVLEHYSLKELPVPSAWEFITQPRKTPVKPKPEEPVNSGRKTPTVSITQFAKPMSPSTIQAQFAAANATAVATKQKQAEELAAKATESPQPVVTVQKEEPKSDQAKLNFFSPSRPHQWKMVSSGSSQREGKRLVLMPSQPSSETKTNQSKQALNDVSNTTPRRIQLNPAEDQTKVVDLENKGENSRDAIILE